MKGTGQPPAAGGADLVIGIGNPLRGDDGVAVHLIQALEPGPRLRVLLRQQLVPELAAELVGVGRLLLVDAWRAPAGARASLRPIIPAGLADAGGAGATWALSHQLTPAVLLALADRLYAARPPASLLVVPARACPHGTALSAAAAASLPGARRLLQCWLTQAAHGEELDRA